MLEIVRIPTKPPLRLPHVHIHMIVLLFPMHVQHASGITYECVPGNGTECNGERDGMEMERRDKRWAGGGRGL